jgi:arylsulfatase A-like enzyme
MVIFISPPGITFGTTKGKLVTPNVLLIMADDMGFTDIGRFGAEIYRAG